MLHYQMNVQSIDDISWIIEAAQETINATEKDFEAIRSKKWYKRLWETVTFSKDNQIKMAKGVSSLSKLQEIMIRLLVVLSQNSTEISNAVKQNSDLINRLSITDALLSRQIDKIRFGGTSLIDFSDLDREKKVLIASLLIMADPTAQRNEYSKQHIGSVLQIANITSFDNTIKPDAVDSLSRAEQELLYRMIMIHRYLMDIDFDDSSDVLDCIPISMKRAKEIRASILETACAVSPVFFVTYYEKTNDTFNETNDDDIIFEEFDSLDEVEECESVEDTLGSIDPEDYEDIVLSSILHIPEGETYKFEYKNIHVLTFIDCEGNLEFRNCIIHYGENGQFYEINVKQSGSLSMKHCIIEGHESSEQFFIKVDTNCGTTEFLDCQFLNCSCFLSVCNAFSLQQCNISNLGGKFINSHSWNEIGTIKNTSFEDKDIPDFIIRSRCQYQARGITCRNLIVEASSIKGNIHINSADEAAVENKNNGSFYFIDSDNLKICDSSFIGVENTLYCNGKILNSTFKQCRKIILSKGYFESVEVNECSFSKCTYIGDSLSKGSKITHCKFNNCYNRLISSSGAGDVSIEFCEFNQWSAVKDNNARYADIFSYAMIEFCRYKGKNYSSNSVKNCTFDEITAHRYFVILGNVSESIDGYVAYVENCSFANCTTERDSGKIIKEFDDYLGAFKKRKNIKTVSIASNCRGLDQVKKV